MLSIYVQQNKGLDGMLRIKQANTNPPAGLPPVLAVGVATVVLV